MSAVILAPIALGITWIGGWLFALIVAIGAVVLVSEWSAVSRARPSDIAVIVAGGCLAAAVVVLAGGYYVGALGLVLAAAVAGQAVAWPSDPARLLGVGAVYAGLPAMALVVLRADPAFGFAAIVWVFVVVWSTDSGGYVAGRLLGGPKLAPRISPKKTWAGFFGGIAMATAASGVLSTLWAQTAAVPLWLAPLLAVISQIGDLAESAFKRRFGAKDSGNLIPGHGGLMDRVDGLIAVAVVAAAIGIGRGGIAAAGTGLLLW
jgi:phosphatidate cytidylyltransferase